MRTPFIFRIFRTGEQSRSRSKSLTPNRPPFRTDAPTVQICGVAVTFALPSCATSARSKSLVTRHRTGQVIPHFRTRSTGRRRERGTHVTSTASTASSRGAPGDEVRPAAVAHARRGHGEKQECRTRRCCCCESNSKVSVDTHLSHGRSQTTGDQIQRFTSAENPREPTPAPPNTSLIIALFFSRLRPPFPRTLTCQPISRPPPQSSAGTPSRVSPRGSSMTSTSSSGRS